MRSRSFEPAEKLIVILMGLFIFLFFFHKLVEPGDLWWHLKTGQWIVDHGQVPDVDMFPFAGEKTVWNNYEWLGSVILYLAIKTGGILGLKLLRLFLLLPVLGLFFVYSRRRLPLSFLVLLTLTMSYALYQRAFLRPDSFNTLFTEIFLMSLFSYEAKGGLWKLWVLLPAGVIWYNIHPGALLYGAPMIFIFWLSAFLKILKPGRPGHPTDHTGAGRQVKELSLILLAYLAVFIINPYGLEGLLLPYKMLLFPAFFDYYKKIFVTSEFQPPAAIFMSLQYFYYWLLMACPVALLVFNKKGNFILIVLYSAALFGFLHMIRNSNFFSVVTGFVIVHAAQDIGFNEKWSKVRWSALADRAILGLAAFFCVVQIFNMVNESAFINGQRVRSLSLGTNPYVVSSIKVLTDNGIHGPVFNSSLLGSSLLWFGYPQLRAFNDSRDADKVRFANYVAAFYKPEKSWRQIEAGYGLKIALINLQDSNEIDFIRYFFTLKDWQLIALRGYIAVCVKRGEFRLPEALDKFEERLKSETLTEGDIRGLKILCQRKPRAALDRFLDPSPVEVDLFSQGESLAELGYWGAAARSFTGALKVSDQPYIQKAVGGFLAISGQT